ncbi:hypothetical protein ACTWQB_17150 [Piscibacillus sp. B03]|uniref:hypothetical protein n=1 Tax=Piscibacillus sp. B03 TaxID=3457430 RepID=UPI003FCD2564
MTNELLVQHLTADDLEFLNKLGKELKTQDNRATRKPVIVKVSEREKELYLDPNEYSECLLIGPTKHNVRFFDWSLNTEGKRLQMTAIKEGCRLWFRLNDQEVENIQSLEDVRNICEQHDWYFAHTGYEYREKVEKHFLTIQEAEEFINSGSYRYKDTQLFIESAHESEEMRRLLEIVEKFGDDIE